MNLFKKIPALTRAKWNLILFGLFKIKMIGFIRTRLISISDESCVIRIPLNHRSRNHLGSMYFGALAVGADVAGGLIAWRLIQQSGKRISLIFKDFHAEFTKRAESDVVFRCDDGKSIQELVKKALEGSERVECPVHIVATCPETTGSEPVAHLKLTLSLKNRT